MIVLEAKILLKQTSLTVSEIATRLGFEDISYFTRVFRKNSGMTPKLYRDPKANAASE
jgi:AraC-like DNA-binding protein